jgi:hypothetical protein
MHIYLFGGISSNPHWEKERLELDKLLRLREGYTVYVPQFEYSGLETTAKAILSEVPSAEFKGNREVAQQKHENYSTFYRKMKQAYFGLIRRSDVAIIRWEGEALGGAALELFKCYELNVPVLVLSSKNVSDNSVLAAYSSKWYHKLTDLINELKRIGPFCK